MDLKQVIRNMEDAIELLRCDCPTAVQSRNPCNGKCVRSRLKASLSYLVSMDKKAIEIHVA